MSDNYEQFDRIEFIPSSCSIKVIGIGSGGINAVAGMLSKLESVEFWAFDTDVEMLDRTPIPNHLILGDKSEWKSKIATVIDGANLVFLIAGMGGRNGLDVAIEVAKVSKEIIGALTIGLVTRPFSFEGIERCTRATIGIEQLVSHVDSLVTISNDKILLESEDLILGQSAFILADNILLAGVRPLISLITVPGIIGLDFTDIRACLADTGLAYFAIGKGYGKSRARDAALQVITSPLLEGSLEDAKSVFWIITGSADLMMSEVITAAEVIYEVVDPNANILYGTLVDENMDSEIQISMIAAGLADRI
jgi:cell division protein FtsZ